MTILLWNVRRLGRPKKRGIIKNIVKQSKCTVVCFQETKLENINPSLVKSTCGVFLSEWHYKPANGSFGGLLTCWTQPLLSELLLTWRTSTSLPLSLWLIMDSNGSSPMFTALTIVMTAITFLMNSILSSRTSRVTGWCSGTLMLFVSALTGGKLVTPRTQHLGRVRDGRTLLRASPKKICKAKLNHYNLINHNI